MRLPSRIDLTKENKLIECQNIGEDGYIENTEYIIQIQIQGEDVIIDYYGEDDTMLSNEHPELLKKLIDKYNTVE